LVGGAGCFIPTPPPPGGGGGPPPGRYQNETQIVDQTISIGEQNKRVFKSRRACHSA
jgi:hypothetical protein